MKLRNILLILAFLSLASISMGGYIYYSSLKESTLEQIHQKVISRTRIIALHIDSTLAENQKSVKALAGLKELHQALEDRDERKILKANMILDHFHKALNVEVCYLMDEQGNTVASSNRAAPDSFVGKNYAFRPYFQKAKQGVPSIYMALGVTSGKRGLYFSHPVYGKLNELPSGVVVVKGSTEAIEQEINQVSEGVMLLTDPNGVIFVSNHEDWLFHLLWKVSPDEIIKISKTQQFGKGPWNWTGIERESENRVIDKSGIEYHIHQSEIKIYPGWKVIYLHDSRAVIKNISDPLFKTAGLIIIILCLVIGLTVLFLYREASHDIVLRKKANEALEKEKGFSDSLISSLPGVFYLFDEKKLRFHRWNRNLETVTGYSSSEIAGMSLLELFDQYEGVHVAERIGQAFEKGYATVEAAFLTKKGDRIPYFFTGHALKIEEKTYLIGLGIDITDRKKAVKALWESEERYRTMLEQAADAVFVHDKIGRILDVNQKACQSLGYSRENLLCMSIGDIDPDAIGTGKPDIWGRILAGEHFTFESRHKRKDGSFFPVEVTLGSVNLQTGPAILGIVRDIADRKRLESRLQQAEKMESIGTLAGGIAHDFNNILSSVIGYTELALDEVAKGTTIEDNLQEVYAAGKRARDLVKQILAFARQSDVEIKPVQIGGTAEEVLKFIRSTIPTTIEIKQNINSKSLIMGNATQVHQLLMNLCINAAHAMEDKGGCLEISIKDVVIDNTKIAKTWNIKSGDYIEIKVSDTGVGISPDILGSIFEPYFTTKDVGEGTGMGLAVVHGIVESYGGKITVDSRLSNGTVFTIYLPITRKRAAHRPYESEKLPSGTERILFIDDEASIAKIGSQILERLGYSVTTRISSIEALELFRSKPNDFDLVITDMTMPNMTGDKLASELMNIRSDISIILCTGYSKKISDETALEIGIKSFAYKPIVKADLAKTVRKVLDEAKTSTQV